MFLDFCMSTTLQGALRLTVTWRMTNQPSTLQQYFLACVHSSTRPSGSHALNERTSLGRAWQRNYIQWMARQVGISMNRMVNWPSLGRGAHFALLPPNSLPTPGPWVSRMVSSLSTGLRLLCVVGCTRMTTHQQSPVPPTGISFAHRPLHQHQRVFS